MLCLPLLDIKDLKSGKSYGLDGLSADHYKYASDKLSALLSIIFNCILVHGYLPEKYVIIVIVSIV